MMTRFILFIALFLASLLNAQHNFDSQMKKGFHLWESNKLEEAKLIFQELANSESTKWLPNYYVALIATTQAFAESDKDKMKSLLEVAQKSQDRTNELAQENPEVLILQAMIHTAWIVYDPMTNGQRLSSDVLYILNKAYKIAPDNPRVVFQKASFEKGMAQYFGEDIKPMCAQIEKAIELFATFKPESSLHPNWGLDKATEVLQKCK